MIRFSCPHCGKPYRIDDSHAGKKGKCSKCGLQFRVPANTTVPKDVPTPITATPKDTFQNKKEMMSESEKAIYNRRFNDEEPEGDYPEFGDIKLRIKGSCRTITDSYRRMKPLGKGIMICGSLLVLLGIFFWVVLPIFGLMFIHENKHGTTREVIDAIKQDMDDNNRWAYNPKEPNLQGSYLVSTYVGWYDKWDNIYPAIGQQNVGEGCIKYVIEGKADVYYHIHIGLSDNLVRATVVINVFYSWNPETKELKYIATKNFLHSVK